ncbi:unnamed protein product [Kuraishia capsulata CBS 1993]|uniref:PRA1 family protein n=1 Tax=Kuraishia capsulata CBS 1993 TaxID=1382522 RepID=W6MUB4_9ASCO|nr:uncharacterized protein KUCA_T00001490001 [Kuraishia capsulata CBS 1993]CDK25520.1 unnamed protein product [Kuraishia capsulata CBS 1993]
MSSFVPAHFGSFTQNFDFERLRTDTSSSLQMRIRSLRPPQDFFDYRRLSKPRSVYDLQTRVLFNLNYFYSNYLAVFLVISAYCLITNLPLLFVLSFVLISIYFIQRLQGGELNLQFVRISTSQLYTLVLFIAIPILFISSPVSTLFWLASASAVVILGHAALLEKPADSAFSDTV